MVVAAPVAAQTITAPGLYGQLACVGGREHRGQPPHIGISSVINASGTQSLTPNNFNQITYSFLRGRVGDAGTSSFPVKLKVYNARTGSEVVDREAGTVNSTDTALPNTAVSFSAAEKTPYFAILYADVTGLGESNPLDTVCFMTGGSYTINNLSINNGSNGCFSISPRTPQDVRNCLCGRPASGSVTIDGSAVSYDYSSIRSNWQCDSAG
ncbi:MAG: hypothetical protein OXC68_11335 [Aestuariivita sp.]|nr:hypothetical protein [Aestuariivita sp.]